MLIFDVERFLQKNTDLNYCNLPSNDLQQCLKYCGQLSFCLSFFIFTRMCLSFLLGLSVLMPLFLPVRKHPDIVMGTWLRQGGQLPEWEQRVGGCV